MPAATRSMAGKTVLITGGTGGIGRAAAIVIASMGARVGITARLWRISADLVGLPVEAR